KHADEQLNILEKRVIYIRRMQVFGVMSFIFNLMTIILVYLKYYILANYIFGFGYNGRLYLWESGSVLTNIGLNLNEKKSDFTYIPPEALNGQTLGKNTSASIRLNYFLKQDISLSFSFNYLNNKRYNNLLNIIGEFRAYL
ncbi:MAG: DUF2721 domain-containing protein, partial [Candidatus Marinimicrobia bacterium]|nr:DUF2721 domain-containing protein [Candidatus Neomarinimicrobiota bacterium]